MNETQSYAGSQTSQTIVGYFENHENADRALEQLRDAGFTSAHLGAAHRHGGSPGASATTSHDSRHTGPGVWDKIKNFFEGGAEPYADERTQGDLATHEVTTNPADSSRYAHDDLHNSLSGLSVPQERLRYFGDRFGSSENGAIVTVNAGKRNVEAEKILRDNGADLGEKASEYAGANRPAETTGRTEGLQNVQLLGEILRVHKDRVNRGEVTIRKDVVSETQTVEVPVTREELVIERHAATGRGEARGAVGADKEIRIPLSEETASVDKATVVREEVEVGKKTVGGVRDLSGEVRHEELVVDDKTKRAVNQ